MSHSHTLPTPISTSPAVPVIPLSRVAPWLVLAVLVALVALYFVSSEQGATALLLGTGVHEWVHDGRHLLGVPCH